MLDQIIEGKASASAIVTANPISASRGKQAHDMVKNLDDLDGASTKLIIGAINQACEAIKDIQISIEKIEKVKAYMT